MDKSELHLSAHPLPVGLGHGACLEVGQGNYLVVFSALKGKKKPNIKLGEKFETKNQESLDLVKRKKHHFDLIHWQNLKLKPI